MTVQLLSGLSKESSYPIGTMMGWHGYAAPVGWLVCNGSEVAISSYPQLYNALTNNGATFPYGPNTNGSGGAGSTHFRLPNVDGRFVMAPSLLSPAVSGANSNVGATAGSNSHTHTWDLGLSISASGSHTHSHNIAGNSADGGAGGGHTPSPNPNWQGASSTLNGTLTGSSPIAVSPSSHVHAMSTGIAALHNNANNHTHPFSFQTVDSSHSHSYTVSGNSYTPSGASHLPPHISLGLLIILAA